MSSSEENKIDQDQPSTFENNNIDMTNAELSKDEPSSEFVSFVTPKPVQRCMEEQQIDAKSLEFDALIVRVNDKILLENLQKVYNFLKSCDDELEFPDILEDLEEVLLRIVYDVNVLSSPRIYSTCKQVSDQIMATVKANVENKVYMVVCVYKQEPQHSLLQGLGVRNPKTLTYKKLYYTERRQKSPAMSMSSPVSRLSRSSVSSDSQLSRSSSAESLTSQRSAFEIKIPTKKKYTHYLRLMLKFIKNKDQPSLEFGNLNDEEAQFLYSFFNSVITERLVVSVDNKKLCTAICEASKIMGLQYGFRIRYLETYDKSRTLALDKFTKINTEANVATLALDKFMKMRTEENVAKTEVKATPEKQVKNQLLKKSVMRFKQFISTLSSEFITHNLQKTLNFFSDETEASVSFDVMCGDKKRFVKNIINYCNSPNLKSVFPVDQRTMLDNIQTLVENKVGYKMRIKEKKKPCGEWQVLFMKLPKYDKPAPNSRPWKKRFKGIPGKLNKKNNGKRYPEAQPAPSKPARQRMDPAKRKGKAQFVPSFETIKQSRTAAFSQTWVQPSPKVLKNGSDPGSSSKPKTGQALNINFKSGGILSQEENNESSLVLESERDPNLVEAMRKYDQEIKDLPRTPLPRGPTVSRAKRELTTRPRQVLNRGNTLQTVQLIEALSVPVKCDKAMRMMKGMGWDGGALGTRGQGIKEPLMPHLSGFVVHPAIEPEPKPQWPPIAVPTLCVSNNPRTSAKFRRTFLEQLLELLSSSHDSKPLQFHPVLNKKEKYFMSHVIRNFAGRTSVSVADEDQKVLVQKIAAQYKKDPELMVTACIADDMKQVMLTKIHSPRLASMNQTHKQKSSKINQYINMAITDNVKTVMDAYASLVITEKSYTSAEFRVEILLKVLEFVKDDTISKFTMDFEKPLTVKQKLFVDLYVKSANKRRKFGYSSPEVAVAMEITRIIGDYKMIVKFTPCSKSFTVTKEHNIRDELGRKIRAADVPAFLAEQTRLQAINEQIKNDKENKTIEEIKKYLAIDNHDTHIENGKHIENATIEIIDDTYSNRVNIANISKRTLEDVNNINEIVTQYAEVEQPTKDLDNASQEEEIVDASSVFLKVISAHADTSESNTTAKKVKVDQENTAVTSLRSTPSQDTDDNGSTSSISKLDISDSLLDDEEIDKEGTAIENGQHIENVTTETIDETHSHQDNIANIAVRTVEDINNIDTMVTNNDEIKQQLTIKERQEVVDETNDLLESKVTAKNNTVMEQQDIAMTSLRSTPLQDTDDNESFGSVSKLDSSDISQENFNDLMSISDRSAYTANLDYSETEDDVSMIEVKDDEGTKMFDSEETLPVFSTCDKPLELSFKSGTVLNTDAKESQNSQNAESEKDVKIVYLTKNYFLAKNMPKYIQGLISLNIVQTKELPLLRCHGVQNGALVYCCHTKRSYDWLQKVCVTNNINMINKEFDKMSLRVNSYFEFGDDYFFNMLEIYNKEINTKEWRLLRTQVLDDCVIFDVKMDQASFKYILESDLALYAGVDKITFSIIWE